MFSTQSSARAAMIPLAMAALLSVSASAEALGLSTLYSFCSQSNCADGANPGGLTADRKGNLYGVANIGGAANDGVVYELSPAAKEQYSFSLLYSFCAEANCADGSRPNPSLIIDRNGNLYGTTDEGGAQGYGAVFEVTNKGGSWSERLLYSFCASTNCADGSLPVSGLTYAGQNAGKPYDGSSPLFGTTEGGGNARFGGTAYELTTGGNGWSEAVLHDFCSEAPCTDGANVMSPLAEDAKGNLFGVTAQGGSTGDGIAFELTATGNTWSETILHVFCQNSGCSDGELPEGGVAIDAKGRVVGVTNEGGVNCVDADHTGGCGTIWRITPNSKTPKFEVVYALGRDGKPDGANPSVAPLLDARGNIYGAAEFGGTHRSGAVFELAGKKLKVLYAFCALGGCADGAEPSGLLRMRAGQLFGTAASGGSGADSSGTAFALTR